MGRWSGRARLLRRDRDGHGQHADADRVEAVPAGMRTGITRPWLEAPVAMRQKIVLPFAVIAIAMRSASQLSLIGLPALLVAALIRMIAVP